MAMRNEQNRYHSMIQAKSLSTSSPSCFAPSSGFKPQCPMMKNVVENDNINDKKGNKRNEKNSTIILKNKRKTGTGSGLSQDNNNNMILGASVRTEATSIIDDFGDSYRSIGSAASSSSCTYTTSDSHHYGHHRRYSCPRQQESYHPSLPPPLEEISTVTATTANKQESGHTQEPTAAAKTILTPPPSSPSTPSSSKSSTLVVLPGIFQDRRHRHHYSNQRQQQQQRNMNMNILPFSHRHSSSSSSSSALTNIYYSQEISRKVVDMTTHRLLNKTGVTQETIDWLNNGSFATHLRTIRHDQILLDRSSSSSPLGTGANHNIYRIESISHDGTGSNNGTVPSSTSSSTGLVVKILRKKLLNKPSSFARAAADLVHEGILLASLQHNSVGNNGGDNNDGGGDYDYSQQHPNIVSLFAWSYPTGLHSFSNGRYDGFFLVLEELQPMTLRDKIEQEWQPRLLPPRLVRKMAKKGRGGSKKLSSRFPVMMANKKMAYLKQRLQVLLEVSNALRYLHQRKIIHRDLKPENIGFALVNNNNNINDDDDDTRKDKRKKGKKSDLLVEPLQVKLFDFDVSRVLPSKEDEKGIDDLNTLMKKYPYFQCHNNDDDNTNNNVNAENWTTSTRKSSTVDDPPQSSSSVSSSSSSSPSLTSPFFHLTGKIGSLRYMSPECGRGDPYNCSSDVYSFGLLMMEVITLHKPYNDEDGIDELFCSSWNDKNISGPNGKGSRRRRGGTSKLHHQHVFYGDHRPPIDKLNHTIFQFKDKNNKTNTPTIAKRWPKSFIQLMKRCWDVNPTERPTMEEIHYQLQCGGVGGGGGIISEMMHHEKEKNSKYWPFAVKID